MRPGTSDFFLGGVTVEWRSAFLLVASISQFGVSMKSFYEKSVSFPTCFPVQILNFVITLGDKGESGQSSDIIIL